MNYGSGLKAPTLRHRKIHAGDLAGFAQALANDGNATISLEVVSCSASPTGR